MSIWRCGRIGWNVAPDTPANHGHYRPLRVICPPGNLFHAVYPSATYTLWTVTIEGEKFTSMATPTERCPGR